MSEDSALDDVGPMMSGGELEISALQNEQVVHAPSSVSVRQAAEIMDSEGIGLLVLQDDGAITGVLSERDVLKAVGAGVDLDAPVSSVEHGHSILRAAPTATVGDVATEMMENYVRHVLITDADGRPSGIVSVRDLLSIIVS